MKLRESPRLKSFDYTGSFAYSLTLVTGKRLPHFRVAETVESCLEVLQEACSRYCFQCIAYCFMPDHLHLLLVGKEEANLPTLVRHFKQISAFRFKCRTGVRLWQISYYDHVLRREEHINTVAEYIWNNPVRAGLVESALGYPFSGPRDLMGQA